jgi:hypothetical protein
MNLTLRYIRNHTHYLGIAPLHLLSREGDSVRSLPQGLCREKSQIRAFVSYTLQLMAFSVAIVYKI